MTTSHFHLPDPVRQRIKSQGEAGALWADSLPAHVDRLKDLWDLAVGGVLAGGSEALVLEVTRSDGTLGILKLCLPHSGGITREAEVLRLADGRGYARLYAHDTAANAMLMERLGPTLASEKRSVDDQIAVLCATMQEAWRLCAGTVPDLTTGAEKAQWLKTFILETWRKQAEPCERAIIHRALDACDRRMEADDPHTSVLVHGDIHEFNTLRILDPNTEGYKFIDPDGLWAEPACDLATVMRSWDKDLLDGDALALGRARCARLAHLTGADETAIWQWGFMERVSTGLHCLELGMTDEGRDMLAVAARWLDG